MTFFSPFAQDDDRPREECGIFATYNNDDAFAHTVLGLHALQHRGQEAAGIVCYDGKTFNAHRAVGLVGDNFNDPKVVDLLVGPAAIGHVRYSTAGGSAARNIQPLYADLDLGGFAIAHNGNLTNAHILRQELTSKGSLFQSTADTEVIIHLMARSLRRHRIDRLVEALSQVEGAYSIVALNEKMVIGVRDPLGVRPLVIGKIGESYILASESCALDIMGAEFIRDVEPGEVVILDSDGLHSRFPFPRLKPRSCIFEYLYFARPDSVMEGVSVYESRKRAGEELAKESHVPADVVVPVPDSGVPAALGYANQAQIPFELGIIRNHYVGRTFIEPTQQIRHLGVKLKHNANSARLKGQRVILVDDSIVRGTTSIKIVEMVRAAGATEVHMRIAAPPTASPCYYGIDTPEKNELLAHKMPGSEMAAHIGVDSLAFISVDGLYQAVAGTKRDNDSPQYCDACFTNSYPTRLSDKEEKRSAPQLSLLSETA